MCQCPVSGSRLITTVVVTDGSHTTLVCQCPVSGSRLITPIWGQQEGEKNDECQCPVSGSRLITKVTEAQGNADAINVSMPCLGLTSDHFHKEEKMYHDNMCQCPVSGSRLITPPPKIPNVYAAFRPLFFEYFSELSDF